MYLDHFGLQTCPFSITPDSSLFYSGCHRGEILEQLLGAILAGEGFVKVIGDVGSGKTMLCRVLCQRLPKTVQVALLLNPNVPHDELAGAILREFRVPAVTSGGRAAEQQAMLDHLVAVNRAGHRAVLLVEEAQCMPVTTLEELRLISNLETEHTKLLQIVLIGQPELDQSLRTHSTRQILERITTSLTLPPLTLNDTEHYLQNRLWATGYRGNRLFTEGAVRCLHQTSQGRMRQINLLADKALQAACNQGAHNVTTHHVQRAMRSYEFTPNGTCRNRPALVAAGIAALLAGGLALHSWTVNSPLRLAFDFSKPAAFFKSALSVPIFAPNTAPSAHPVGPHKPSTANTTAKEFSANPSSLARPKDLPSGAESDDALVVIPIFPNKPISTKASGGETVSVSTDPSPAVAQSTPAATPLNPARQTPTMAPPATASASANVSGLLLDRKLSLPLSDVPASTTATITPTSVNTTAANETTTPNDSIPPPESTPVAGSTPTAIPTTVPAQPPPHDRAKDLLQETISASLHWLKTSDDAHFTIRIVQLSKDSNFHSLKKILADGSNTQNNNTLRAFRLKSGSVLIYLNEYDSQEKAQKAINLLPKSILASQPRVRSLKVVKASLLATETPTSAIASVAPTAPSIPDTPPGASDSRPPATSATPSDLDSANISPIPTTLKGPQSASTGADDPANPGNPFADIIFASHRWLASTASAASKALAPTEAFAAAETSTSPEISSPLEVPAAPEQEPADHATASHEIQATAKTTPPLHPTSPKDPLEDSILSSYRWLETSNEDHFTIQLVQLRNDSGLRELEKQLAVLAPFVSSINLKSFRLRNGSLLVYLNEFKSQEETIKIINRLPKSIQAGRPRAKSLKMAKATLQKLSSAIPCPPEKKGTVCLPPV